MVRASSSLRTGRPRSRHLLARFQSRIDLFRAQPMKRPRNLRKKLLLITFGLLFGLFMSEIFLRVVGYSYPLFYTTDYYRGFALQPGVAGHNLRERWSGLCLYSERML